MKRIVDVLVASVAMVVALPILGMLAVLVLVRMGRPVLFRQHRAGQGGRPIAVPKLRTMTEERDASGVLLPDEQRITALGRFLRASSLDELPQLWSIVKGDMSLVGPRPLPISYVDRYSERQRRRLEVVPGLTGWAQINGRNAISWPEKLELDVWYVEHRNVWLDLKIMVRTLQSLISRSGVSAEGHATMPEFMGES